MTTTNNSIANIASTLVGNKPANPKTPSKGITMLSPEVTLASVTSYANGIKLGNDAVSLMNDALKPFHDAKVKLVKASETKSPLFAYSNQVRTMFIDSFKGAINPKSNKGYSKDYVEKRLYPAFLIGVNSGKPINNMHDNINKNKSGKSKGEKTEAQYKADLIKALTTIYELSDAVPSVIEFIDNSIESGNDFMESVIDFLKSEDVEIA